MKIKLDLTLGRAELEVLNALVRLYEYRSNVEYHAPERIRERLGEIAADAAKTGFEGAVPDDFVDGSSREAEVDVELRKNVLGTTVVEASGRDAAFIEFGAGVYHNGDAGGSPHPKGLELGATIGGYGAGLGKRKVWGFAGADGEVKLTHGTPMAMPMYKAAQTARDQIVTVAKAEVKRK